MTQPADGPATYGQLLDVARNQVRQAAAVPGRPPDTGRDLPDIRAGLHALAAEISRCLPGPGQVTSSSDRPPASDERASSPWPEAAGQAQRAAARAARILAPPTVTTRRRPATEQGRHLHAAARALAATRDLLATYDDTGPGTGPGTAGGRSGEPAGQWSWSAALSSPQISRAVTAEMASLARQAGAFAAGIAQAAPPDWAETSQPRRDLAGASGYLRIIAGSVLAAHRQDPVLAADQALLRDTPAAAIPPRRTPQPADSVTALSRGVISAAERLRRSAAEAARRDGRSADVSATSLRQSAAAAVAVSHHCSVLLDTLGASEAAAAGNEAEPDAWTRYGLTAALSEANKTAGEARDAWLRTARTLDHVTSDLNGHMAAEASDVRDLALWTGRLAYADPDWTPASAAKTARRPAAQLAAGPRETAEAVAAVHHASESLTRLAYAHEQQARAATRARRFLAPAPPHRENAARRYGPAGPETIAVILAAYRQTRQANTEAQTRAGVVAEAVSSPSNTLTRARELAARQGTGTREPGPGRSTSQQPSAATYKTGHVPGPVERSLQMLGITDPARLRHAASIDRSGEQLAIEACASRDPQADRHAQSVLRADQSQQDIQHPGRDNRNDHHQAAAADPGDARPGGSVARHKPERQAE